MRVRGWSDAPRYPEAERIARDLAQRAQEASSSSAAAAANPHELEVAALASQVEAEVAAGAVDSHDTFSLNLRISLRKKIRASHRWRTGKKQTS